MPRRIQQAHKRQDCLENLSKIAFFLYGIEIRLVFIGFSNFSAFSYFSHTILKESFFFLIHFSQWVSSKVMFPATNMRSGQQETVFRFYWSNFREFISMEMMFHDETLFNISFSYTQHVQFLTIWDQVLTVSFHRKWNSDLTDQIFICLSLLGRSFMPKQHLCWLSL